MTLTRLPSKASLLLLVLFVFGSTTSCGQDATSPNALLEKGWRDLLILTGNRADDTDALLDAMEISEGDWVADVGSGDGDYTIPMAERVGPSGRVFAVDVDADALNELNERLRDNEIEHVTSVYSVEDNPMLPPNTLDAVLVRKAYHHFTAPESMLRHIKAALKSNGRLVIEESINEDMIGKSRAEQVDNHDLGIAYVREELKAAGFTIQKEVNPLMETNWGVYWMIVATRPG
jgi:ubiquinone/menaquinone biosynthesis C-methylase UbiE